MVIGEEHQRGAARKRGRGGRTVLRFRSTRRIQGIGPEGEALEVLYYTDARKALLALFELHNVHGVARDLLPEPASAASPLRRAGLRDLVLRLGLRGVTLWEFARGRFTVAVDERQLEPQVDVAPEALGALRFLQLPPATRLYLVHSVQEVNRCEDCGRFYKADHICNVRRREFYFHQVDGRSAGWWEEIQFFPLGACPQTHRLYVTYDVETYTFHGACGKQLVPFMLVFALTGEPWMVREAEDIARRSGWLPWTEEKEEGAPIFYCLDPRKRAVGSKFKDFRNRLQLLFTQRLWDRFLDQNPEILERAPIQFGLDSPDDLEPGMLKQFKARGKPAFWEVYVVGHNINGFDEIVLAAQVIQHHHHEVCKAFRVSRNFMPRNGKILFNDITFGLPNPVYEKRHAFELWEEGGCDETDFKEQYVRFLVRDTFALTHVALRKAAVAYNLEVAKGHCPYGAVNQFYMLGSYDADSDGFPDVKYWASQREYDENRRLWLQEKQPRYDIVQQTLRYCVQDVIVTYRLVDKLVDSYADFIHRDVGLPACDFNILQRPTISSNSHAIFRQILFREQRPDKNNLGNALLAPSREMYEYVRQSIRGGRCYPTYIGILDEPIFVYDICGMYASALTHPFPSGAPLPPFDRDVAIKAWQDALDGPEPIDYFTQDLLPGIFTIDADAPEELWLDTLPPFCSRKGGRLVWTNENLRGEVATSIDLITLHNRKWKVRILADARATVFPEWRCLCQSYVRLNIQAKERADRDKNQTVRSIAKLLSNALYGSFATKLDNKKIVFGDQLEDCSADIAAGKLALKATSFIEVDDFSAEILPEFRVTFAPVGEEATVRPERTSTNTEDATQSGVEDEGAALYSPPAPADASHAPRVLNYKPIVFLDADDQQLCLHTLEKNTDIIENNRYPSQIASFVLAWTRAFVSEWASFLFAEDWGRLPIEERPLKAVYGDTDSLFLTARGRELMETIGKHRLKKSKNPLVFDPDRPDLTWLVECETQCERCGGDAYATQSVFLAPKLYALRDTRCDSCRVSGKGKLRAKGHAAEGLDYDTLVSCYLADAQQGNAKYSTSRLSLKRVLASAQESAVPFTVTETILTRTLRPWKDKTLVHLDQHRLAPYSNRRPNPRNREECLMELPWTM